MSLTQEQQIFAEHPNGAFVKACPGAGKTKTIIARLQHISSSLPPRKGVAVISFTNKAVEEFCSRFARFNISEVLKNPGFVGTFDSFVRHFLFEPAGIPGLNAKPHVVDSWDTLSDTEIRLRDRNSFRGAGVKLDWFDPETNKINPNSITHAGLKQHVKEHKTEYETTAQIRRTRLHKAGFFSAADARVIAWQRITSSEWSEAIGKALAGRFIEVIVDEAQDCNQKDLDILRLLQRYGVRVTLVCDMDQAIYEFRDGDRLYLEKFSQSYPVEDRLGLTGNFRSSPAICRLASSLKVTAKVDSSLGKTRLLQHPIAIYAYHGRKATPAIGQWFISHCGQEAIGIPLSELIVLSHSTKVARLASGNFVEASSGTSKVEFIATAFSNFWASTTGKEKRSALSNVEKWILDVFNLRNGNEQVAEAVKRHNIEPRQLERQSFELITSLPKTCLGTPEGASEWIESLRDLVGQLSYPLPAGKTINSILRNPPTDFWLTHLEQADSSTGLKYSTIHNAKGGEFSGVCVVIPPDDSRGFTTALFDSWENKSDYEPKRVVYVGVTRAKKIAALAVPYIFLEKCQTIFDSSGIPYTSTIG